MADKDVIGTFDYDQFGGAGLFLKFKADKPVTIRVLTTDPVISQTEFTDKKTGEVNLNTRFSYIVYNLTDNKAQILSASPAMSRKFGELHMDSDFGANIRKMDIKIIPTGEGLERRYDIQVLRHSGNEAKLTADQIKEAQAINLDTMVNDNRGRMSEWNTNKSVGSSGSDTAPGYEQAKAAMQQVKDKKTAARIDPDDEPLIPDTVINDFGDEPINLDDIPF